MLNVPKVFSCRKWGHHRGNPFPCSSSTVFNDRVFGENRIRNAQSSRIVMLLLLLKFTVDSSLGLSLMIVVLRLLRLLLHDKLLIH